MSDFKEVSEAIRFAEEYGYRDWQIAEEALVRLELLARVAKKIADGIVIEYEGTHVYNVYTTTVDEFKERAREVRFG